MVSYKNQLVNIPTTYIQKFEIQKLLDISFELGVLESMAFLLK